MLKGDKKLRKDIAMWLNCTSDGYNPDLHIVIPAGETVNVQEKGKHMSKIRAGYFELMVPNRVFEDE